MDFLPPPPSPAVGKKKGFLRTPIKKTYLVADMGLTPPPRLHTRPQLLVFLRLPLGGGGDIPKNVIKDLCICKYM